MIFNSGAGKEWRISKNRGLGAMVNFYTGKVDDAPFEGETMVINNSGFEIAIPATFN